MELNSRFIFSVLYMGFILSNDTLSPCMKMESIAKVYGVKFVLDVARFDDNPLWQNVSSLVMQMIHGYCVNL